MNMGPPNGMQQMPMRGGFRGRGMPQRGRMNGMMSQGRGRGAPVGKFNAPHGGRGRGQSGNRREGSRFGPPSRAPSGMHPARQQQMQRRN